MPYIPKQYDSAKAFLRTYSNLGNIVEPQDNMRLLAYNLYDDFYYNRPDTFKVTLRGSSDTEIYLPSTRKMVDSTARFLAVDFNYNVTGNDAVATLFDKIWAREEIAKLFVKGKRSYLNRGDQVWYITADDRKPLGERISLATIHPSSIFRIEDPEKPTRVIGYHIVDLVQDPRDKKDNTKLIARRQTYRKENGRITSECIGFEIGAWDDRYLQEDELKPVWIYLKKRELPQSITSLPVYHIPNNEPDGSTWGLSQVAGIEYIINAMNQSMTTEDLSLVLSGLGVYVSTAAPPIDKATGKPGKYKLHPGNVVEIGRDDTFNRVSGVSSVQPFTEHINSLDDWATSGIGLPDMASGKVDVSVAQSGIALALKMGPIIAENQDKQLGILGKWNQMGYDLINMWFPAFEGVQSDGAKFVATVGDPMPLNRDTYVQETQDLYDDDLITIEEARERLEKIGYAKSATSLIEKLWEQKEKKAQIVSGDAFLGEAGANSANLVDTLGNSGDGNGDQQTGTVNGRTNGKTVSKATG